MDAALASLGVRVAATSEVEQHVAEHVQAQAERLDAVQRLDARLAKLDKQIAATQALLSQQVDARKDAQKARQHALQQHRLTELLKERDMVIALRRQQEAAARRAMPPSSAARVPGAEAPPVAPVESAKARILREFREEAAALEAHGASSIPIENDRGSRARLVTTSASATQARAVALRASLGGPADGDGDGKPAAAGRGKGAAGSVAPRLGARVPAAPRSPRRRPPPPPPDDIDDADDLAFAKRLARVAARERRRGRAARSPRREGSAAAGGEEAARGARARKAPKPARSEPDVSAPNRDSQLERDAALARELALSEARRPTRRGAQTSARAEAGEGEQGAAREGAARADAASGARAPRAPPSDGESGSSWHESDTSSSTPSSSHRSASPPPEVDAPRAESGARSGSGSGSESEEGTGRAARRARVRDAAARAADSEPDSSSESENGLLPRRKRRRLSARAAARTAGRARGGGPRRRAEARVELGSGEDEEEDCDGGERRSDGESECDDEPAEPLPPVDVSATLRMPGEVWEQLFDHQREGARWLAELHEQGVGGIVGDDMGLGKTLQTVALLSCLHHSRVGGPVLIACPATILKQWVRELHRWFPPIRASILHECSAGSKEKTVAQRVRAATTVRAPGDVSVLVTTYEAIRRHGELLRASADWRYLILDEGHKIRNPSAEVTLACKLFGTGHRLILSGSPIQNNLTELWSLLDFVFPGKLGTLPVFTQQFIVPIARGAYTNASPFDVQAAYECSVMLRDLIAPYLLRRLKLEVAAGQALPEKTEHVLFCHLTPQQHELYCRFLGSEVVSATLAGRTTAFAALTALQKISNHPHLFSYAEAQQPGGRGGGSGAAGAAGAGLFDDDDDEEEEEGEARALLRAPRAPAASAASAAKAEAFGDPALSGKLKVLQQVLHAWRRDGHRVLLFSQTRQMLDLLQIFARRCGFEHRRLDGATAIGSRISLIDEFNRDESIFLMLLTTRAGGLGVNLTGADRVVLYDPDWNPANDSQARERAWRIGQRRAVTVYRLVSTGTVEEKVFHRQIFKQLLSNKILKDPKQKRLFRQRDLKDLFAYPPHPDATDGGESGGGGGGGGSPALARGGGARGGARPGAHVPRLASIVGAADGRPGAGARGSDSESLAASDAEPDAAGRRETSLLRQLLDGHDVSATVNHDRVLAEDVSWRLTREEASKVAQRAAAALQSSSTAAARAHTLGGGLGRAPAPSARPGPAAPPRFGRPPRGPAAPSAPRAAPAPAVGGAGRPGGVGLSSRDLIASIRGRQRDIADAASGLMHEPDTFAAAAGGGPGPSQAAASHDEQAAMLLRKLRAHFDAHGGSSTTSQLIGAFEATCTAHSIDKVLFRELLRQIASQSGSQWTLKPR